MAELHVQKKERSVWPWLLAALILIAALFWFVSGRGERLDVGAADATDSAAVGSPVASSANTAPYAEANGGGVTEYLQFVDARTTRSADASHDFTAEGLRLLAAALGEIASSDTVGGVSLQARVDEIRERADAMQANPASTEHAQQAREAFTTAASLMAQMERAGNGSTTDSSSITANQGGLQQAAMAIEPGRPLLEQSQQVEQFFADAGDAIRILADSNR